MSFGGQAGTVESINLTSNALCFWTWIEIGITALQQKEIKPLSWQHFGVFYSLQLRQWEKKHANKGGTTPNSSQPNRCEKFRKIDSYFHSFYDATISGVSLHNCGWWLSTLYMTTATYTLWLQTREKKGFMSSMFFLQKCLRTLC